MRLYRARHAQAHALGHKWRFPSLERMGGGGSSHPESVEQSTGHPPQPYVLAPFAHLLHGFYGNAPVAAECVVTFPSADNDFAVALCVYGATAGQQAAWLPRLAAGA